MSKQTREIKEMTDDELVKFLKNAAKNASLSAQTMGKDYEKGMKSIIEFWKDR